MIPRPDKLIARIAALVCFAMTALLIILMEGRTELQVLALHIPMTVCVLAGASALLYETELD